VSGTLEGQGDEEQASRECEWGKMVQMGCKSEQCGRQQAEARLQQGALLQLTLQTHGPNGRDRNTALKAGHAANEPTGDDPTDLLQTLWTPDPKDSCSRHVNCFVWPTGELPEEFMTLGEPAPTLVGLTMVKTFPPYFSSAIPFNMTKLSILKNKTFVDMGFSLSKMLVLIIIFN